MMVRASLLVLALSCAPCSRAASVVSLPRAAALPGVSLPSMVPVTPGALGGLGLSPAPAPLPSLSALPLPSANRIASPIPSQLAVLPAPAAAPSAAQTLQEAVLEVENGGASAGLEADGLSAGALFDGGVKPGPAPTAAAPDVQPQERYLEGLLQKTRSLYRRYFPMFDAGFEASLAYSGRTRVEGAKGSHEADPRRKGRLHEITLIEDVPPGAENERERSRTPFSRNSEKYPALFDARIQRWVSRLLVLFHEFSHGVFHETTPPISRGFSLPESDMLRVDLAAVMDEGFAVMMELLLIDRLIAEAGAHGLTPADIDDLRIRKKQRLYDMRHRRDHYTAGTFYFMHKIAKRSGEAGLLRFLQDLEMERLYTTFTYDPSYRLIQGSPELFEAYLTKGGDARLREGVDALAAYLAGEAVAEDDARLKDVLRRVSLPALVRVSRLYLKAAKTESDPAIYRGFVDRVARLDAARARFLPDDGPRASE